ncbi:hypothetical protein ABPG72_016872 [Tetrahymena utriculariae]
MNSQQISKKKHSFNINIKKPGEIDSKFKDLAAALKAVSNQDKVELNLETYFENDQDVLKFTIQFQKISNQINYIKWIIKGKFTDEGQSRALGQIVGKLSKAFRIELHFQDTYFADVGAKSLAASIKNLNNLRVFRLLITYPYGRVAKNLSQNGIDLIQDSLKSMNKLEVFESNLTNQGLIGPDSIKSGLSNYVYNLPKHYKYLYNQEEVEGSNKWDLLYQNFIEEISQFDSRITSASFTYYGIYEALSKDSYEIEFEERVSDKKLDFFLKQIKYVFDLQYLTNYLHTFKEEEVLNLKPGCKTVQHISYYNNIISSLTRQRYCQVLQILLFQQFIKSGLNINSTMVLTDLLID